MYPLFQSKGYNSTNVLDLPLRSHDVFDIQQKVKGSIVDKYSTFDSRWELVKAYSINNKTFNRQFNEKRAEFQNDSLLYSQQEIRYGFLATIKESMVHKVGEEGLEVRSCPYNYFGHNISGIHISQNADVCMKEAGTKVRPEDEIILITFKYMLGKHKIVPMYDPNVLLAPTPNFDSHLCEERPDPTEKVFIQYIKSLVYLYEFDNDQLDPVIRPRHCCPVSALVYKQANVYNIVDLTENETVKSRVSVYDDSPLSFLKPVKQSHWGREFLLNTPSGPRNSIDSSLVIQKNDRDDSRKVVMSMYDDNIPGQPSLRLIDNRAERWEPIKHQFDYAENNPVRLGRSERSHSRSNRDFVDRNEEFIHTERDRSFDRLAQNRETSYKGNGLTSASRGLNSRNDMSSLRNWFR